MGCTPRNSGLPHEPCQLPTKGLQWRGDGVRSEGSAADGM